MPIFLLAFVLSAMGSRSLFAAAFYVSFAGNDARTGQSEAEAFQTLNKAAKTAKAGDKVYLRRGDTFRDSGFFALGVSVGAFGAASLPRPVVSGGVELSGWTRHQGNIYVSQAPLSLPPSTGTVPARRIHHLFVNGKLQTLARFPNTGWLRAKTGGAASAATTFLTGGTDLTSHPRNKADYWKGAQLRWRRWSWWFESRPILAYEASGRFTLGWRVDSIRDFNSAEGWGYYLDNKLEELDSEGEWHEDPTTGKVYLWATGGVNPSTLRVEGSVRKGGMSVRDAVVEDLVFRHHTDNGLVISGATTVKSCRFEGIGGEQGGEALRATWDTKNALITHCAFEDILNNAIGWVENPGTGSRSVIEHDTLRRVGVFPGYGGNGDWHASGMVLYTVKGLTIRRNVMEDIGYCGVILGSEGNTVEYNLIKRAMSTLNDGAAIYTNCHRSVIRRNILLDTEGDLESSGPWANLGHAIWPEFLSDFRENVIDSNVGAGSGAFGLFMPNNFSNKVRGNVLFGNKRAQMELEGITKYDSANKPISRPQDHEITGNVLASTEKGQWTLLYRPDYDYGTLRGNYYLHPFTDSLIGQWQANGGWNITGRTLAGWRQAFPKADADPKTLPLKRSPGTPESDRKGQQKLVYNEAFETRRIALDNGVYLLPDGREVSGSVELPGYYGTVLTHTGRTAALSIGDPGRPKAGKGTKPGQALGRVEGRAARDRFLGKGEGRNFGGGTGAPGAGGIGSMEGTETYRLPLLGNPPSRP